MNKIIENFLDIHKKEYSIERLDTETAFEHFTNKCIVNKYSNERFDPSDIMTDPGEKRIRRRSYMCKWQGNHKQ